MAGRRDDESDDLSLDELDQLEESLGKDGTTTDVTPDDPVERRITAAERMVRHLERKKDDGTDIGSQIADRYLGIGRELLADGTQNQLDPALRRRVQAILGKDPGQVRIHTGEKAAAAAESLGARAFALGEGDVFFGRGEYQPHTREGMGVLVHELTHTADNQVAAAMSTGASRASSSAAEARAEASEARAVSGAGAAEAGARSQTEEEEIDIRKLTDTVMGMLDRSNRISSDRFGLSSQGDG